MKRTIIVNLIFPLIIAFLTPFFTALGSQLVTGSWVIWLSNVPLVVWIIFFIGLFAWIIIAFVSKRLKKINDRGGFLIEDSLADWYDVGEKEYNEIIWIIQSTSRKDHLKLGYGQFHLDV